MSEKKLIEDCVDIYYAGCCESDPSKIKKAFDENAMISGYLPDGLHEMNLDEFAGFVEAQQPSPKEKGDEAFLEILSCEIVGDTNEELKSAMKAYTEDHRTLINGFKRKK